MSIYGLLTEIQTLQNIELARDMQDMRIRKKKRQTIRPLPGSLFLTKTSGVSKILLKDAVNGNPPAKYTQKQVRPKLPVGLAAFFDSYHCLWLKMIVLSCKQLHDMFMFLFFSCMDTECISMCLKSPVRMHSRFASVYSSSSSGKRS